MNSTLTVEQKSANKANRLRNAADPNDGLTVRLPDGQIVVWPHAKALAEVAAGRAELAE